MFQFIISESVWDGASVGITQATQRDNDEDGQGRGRGSRRRRRR